LKRLTAQARCLRNNQTDTEKSLWNSIKSRQLSGYKFRRLYVFEDYIVDFVCIELKLIIELDGSQHEFQKEYDATRTEYLNSKGYKVLRFWNNDVLKNMNGVLEVISDTCL
jgi:very-short-patch-repair endonuclease